MTVVRYLLDQWRRHLLIASLFAVLCVISVLIGNYYLVVCVATLWAGRFTRDLQWYHQLSREWPTTVELLDWEKIERLAASANSSRLKGNGTCSEDSSTS